MGKKPSEIIRVDFHQFRGWAWGHYVTFSFLAGMAAGQCARGGGLQTPTIRELEPTPVGNVAKQWGEDWRLCLYRIGTSCIAGIGTSGSGREVKFGLRETTASSNSLKRRSDSALSDGGQFSQFHQVSKIFPISDIEELHNLLVRLRGILRPACASESGMQRLQS